MRYVVGTIVTVLIFCAVAYFTLDLWGIESPITLEQLQKGFKTAIVVGGASLLWLIIASFFFKNNAKGYDRTKGRVAKRKKE